MTCGLDIRAYENNEFIFLVVEVYGVWKINKKSLQEEEISLQEFEETNVKEVNIEDLGGWDVYPRTSICVIKVSNAFLVIEYSGSEGMFYVMKVTGSKQEAIKFARKEVNEYKYPYFWI